VRKKREERNHEPGKRDGVWCALIGGAIYFFNRGKKKKKTLCGGGKRTEFLPPYGKRRASRATLINLDKLGGKNRGTGRNPRFLPTYGTRGGGSAVDESEYLSSAQNSKRSGKKRGERERLKIFSSTILP